MERNLELNLLLFMDQIAIGITNPSLLEKFDNENCNSLIIKFKGDKNRIYNYLEEEYLYVDRF